MKTLQDYIQDSQTACLRKHGVFFAFSKGQFEEQRDPGVVKYVDLGAGTICPKGNAEMFLKEHASCISKGIAQDLAENGKEAIILRELYNHECFYVGDYHDCIVVLEDYGITPQEIKEVFNNAEPQICW